MTLSTPIKDINKIAEKLAPKFKKLGLKTIQELLFYYPYRYDDYSHLIKIKDLIPNILSTIKVKVELINSRRSFRKRMLLTESVVADETGKVKVIWFGQRYVIKILKAGDEIYLSGKPVITDLGLEFHNPNFEKVAGVYEKSTTHTARLVPIYSTTEKLTQKQIRFILKKILPCTAQIKDWLPIHILKQEKLFALSRAIHQIHFPISKQNLAQAKQRLKFDEIFLLQLRAGLIKKELLKFKSQPIDFKQKETKEFVNNLPFQMTQSQKKSAWEIIQDLGKDKPMNRLLEGDVGSGKTITVALAILNVLLNNQSGLTRDFNRGFQVAYMAPTEILAQQQFKVFCDVFRNYDFKIALLTRSLSAFAPNDPIGLRRINSKVLKTEKQNFARERTQKPARHSPIEINKGEGGQAIKKSELIKKIQSGKLDLIIGTHALIQEKINFHNLAFVIVDEQHRFGVEQRKFLRDKAYQAHSNDTRINSHHYSHNKTHETTPSPHFLSMTATPIPRSLALTVYGELDLSIINEMPKGRKSIKTEIISPDRRSEAYEFIRKEIKKGHQIFVICPLIDPSDKLGVKTVKEEFERLDKKIFPKIKIGLLHGRLKTREKEKVMRDFALNKIKILVSTLVVEVGIDVPNATVMLIESAERFGLAQLHQLRGRVGRSEHQSYCFLFTESDSESVIKRLHALVESKNGFELAEKDLEFRGPGEVYGIKQSGFFDTLKIAKLTDWPIIKIAKPWVEKILTSDPELKNHPGLKEKLTDFEMSVHFE